MKDFIEIALWGVTSFIVFSSLWKIAAKRYKKLEAMKIKFSNLKKRNLYSSIITFVLIISIVVIKEMFALGDFGYGLLLGALLSISDFLFNKEVKEDEKDKSKNNKKNYQSSNKSINKRK